MSVNINDLPFDVLFYILDDLPFKQLFMVERVCKDWQKCVKKLLARKKTLDSFGDYSEKFKRNSDYKHEYRYIIDDSNIHILKKILLKCPNITNFHFKETRIYGKNILLTIANLCPKLQRISFGDVMFVGEDNWNEFAVKFGPQLTQCVINSPFDLYLEYQMILFKNFEKIKYLNFETIRESVKLFRPLKSCENLKELSWRHFNGLCIPFNYSDENVIAVLQKIQKFTTELRILNNVGMHMNNLIDLKLIETNERIPVNEIDINKMTFPKLKYLEILINNKTATNVLLKYKFPKTENIKLEIDHFNCFLNLKQQFEQLFSILKFYIKELTIGQLKNCDLAPILSLGEFNVLNLTGINIVNQSDFNTFTNNLTVISNHESLQNIKIYLNDSYLDDNIFLNIAALSNKMHDTKIDIEITASVYDDESLKKNNYQKKLNDIYYLLNPLTKLSLDFIKINHY